MVNIYKEGLYVREINEETILGISSVIENVPYLLGKGYQIRLVGQCNCHSNSGCNSGSECSSRSRAVARVYKKPM